jgi:hypothetical protein
MVNITLNECYVVEVGLDRSPSSNGKLALAGKPAQPCLPSLLRWILKFQCIVHPYSLIVDACTGNDKTISGMGAILCQRDEQGKQRVISYASKQLAKHKKN